MAKTKLFRWLISGVAISLLVLVLPGTALANGAGEGTTVAVGGYQVSLVFAEPAKAGGNPFHVQILDGMGMPVSGAQVEISAMPVEETAQHVKNMASGKPAMAGMDGMDLAPTTAPSGGMAGMGGMDADPTATPSNGMGSMDDAAPVVPVAPGAAQAVDTLTTTLQPGDAAGEYAGEIAFPETGHWMITAHLTINSKALEADFPVDVAGASAGLAVLSGFAGFNIIIIGAAALMKRKPVSA